MLDTTTAVMEIMHKHSSTCELNRYIESHGGIDNLRIEDIRTLVQADQAVFLQMIPVTTVKSIKDTGEISGSSTKHIKPEPSAGEVLPMVTNPSLTTTTTEHVSADTFHTETPLSVVTPLVHSREKVPTLAAKTATPLPMVTSSGSPSGEILTSSITSATPLHMVTEAPTMLTPSITSISEPSTQLKWSRILNRPVESIPTAEAEGGTMKSYNQKLVINLFGVPPQTSHQRC